MQILPTRQPVLVLERLEERPEWREIVKQMDLLQGEIKSCSETSVTSPQVERVNDITEEDLQERMTVPVRKTEPKNCMDSVEGETGFCSETC